MASFSNSIAENIPKAFGTITLLWMGRGRILGGDATTGNTNLSANNKGGVFGRDSDEQEEEEKSNSKKDENGVKAADTRRKNNNRRARRFAKLDAKIVESWIKIREVVIKRYVNHWFKTISDDEEIPNACRAVMDDMFLELEKRATRNVPT